jgi:hypothetical protein
VVFCNKFFENIGFGWIGNLLYKKNEKRNPAVRAGHAASTGAQVGRGAEKLQSRGISRSLNL